MFQTTNQKWNSVLNFECLILIFEEPNQQQMGIDLWKWHLTPRKKWPTQANACALPHMKPDLHTNITQDMVGSKVSFLWSIESYVCFLWPPFKRDYLQTQTTGLLHHVHRLRVVSPNWACWMRGNAAKTSCFSIETTRRHPFACRRGALSLNGAGETVALWPC